MGLICIWDALTGQQLTSLVPPPDDIASRERVVFDLAVSPDGTQLAALETEWLGDNPTIRIWNLETGAQRYAWSPETSAMFHIAFSQDGFKLYTASDNVLQRWNLLDLKLEDEAAADLIGSFSSNDGPVRTVMMLSGTSDAIILWNPLTNTAIRSIQLPVEGGHPIEPERMVLSPDGRRLAILSYPYVYFWNDRTLAWKRSNEESSFPNYSNDNVTQFSPCGTRLLTAEYPQVRIWDPDTGECINAIDSDRMFDSFYFKAAWNPDGTRLVYGLDNGAIRISETQPRSDTWPRQEASRARLAELEPLVKRWVSDDSISDQQVMNLLNHECTKRTEKDAVILRDLTLKHLSTRRYRDDDRIRRLQAAVWLREGVHFLDFQNRILPLLVDVFVDLPQDEQARIIDGQMHETIFELALRANALVDDGDPYLWHTQAQLAWEQSDFVEALNCQDRALSLLNQTKRPNRHRDQFELRHNLYEFDVESGSTIPTSSDQ
jgi:hypothetical protein